MAAVHAAAAAAGADTPVTWEQVAAIAGWVGLGFVGVAIALIALVILAAFAGLFSDWSH